MRGLNPPDWIKSDGQFFKATASLAAGTYYAIVPLQGSHSFGGTLIAGATLIATATVDGNDLPVTDTTRYAATGGTSGWTDCTPVTDVVMNASEGAYAIGATGSVVDFEQSAARVKLVVTQAGTCTFYPTVKLGSA